MSVNGITTSGSTDPYGSYLASQSSNTTETETTTTTESEIGATYESSTSTASATYTPNTNLIDQLKADAEARTAQLQSLVDKLITGQGSAYGQTDSIWSFLASGDFTADAATIAQAQEDISEDGYWGVEATSTRIVDFATALTGGDPDKIEEMREAFIKGYEQATETWGSTLPDISQQTYDAVMAKFDELAGITTTE